MSRYLSVPFDVAMSDRGVRSVITALAFGVFVMIGASSAFAQSVPLARMSGVTFNPTGIDDATPTLAPLVPMSGVTFSPTDDATPTSTPAQPDPKATSKHSGIGIGIKGGPMFAKLDTTDGSTLFQQKAGYQVGLFIGGNRPGVFGVGTEITYIKRNASAQGTTTPSSSATALEIPLLFRLNTGSSHLSGADLYFLFGPSIDINISKFNTSFVSNTTSYDLNGVAGLGVEVTRIIFEFRYNRSFRSVARTLSSNTAVNMHSFVLLVGLRFN